MDYFLLNWLGRLVGTLAGNPQIWILGLAIYFIFKKKPLMLVYTVGLGMAIVESIVVRSMIKWISISGNAAVTHTISHMLAMAVVITICLAVGKYKERKRTAESSEKDPAIEDSQQQEASKDG